MSAPPVNAPAVSAPVSSRPGYEPALAAVRLVAARLGMTIEAPDPALPSPDDPVIAIASASGVRTRAIRLTGEWWRRDLGPFVGYRDADGAPVALVPAGRGYRAALPGSDRLVPVTAALAGTLRDSGVVFYPPLPARVRTAGQLLRFALGGVDRRDLWRLLLTGVAIAVLGLAVPVFTGLVLGAVAVPAGHHLVVDGALVTAVAALVAAAMAVVHQLAALRLSGRAIERVLTALWGRMLALPAPFLRRYSTGTLGRMTIGVSTALDVFAELLPVLTLGVLTVLANAVLIAVLDLRFAVVVLGLAAVLVVLVVAAGAVELRRQRRLNAAQERLSGLVFELLTGLPKLRAAAAEERAFDSWKVGLTDGRRLAGSARPGRELIGLLSVVAPLACGLAVFALAGGPYRAGTSPATVLVVFTATILLVSTALRVGAATLAGLAAVPLLEIANPLLCGEPEHGALTGAGDRRDPGPLTGAVALEHVTFRYGRTGPPVIDDVSLEVRPGEFVAIVGASGSGKSTIVRLLLGLERPDSGVVRYDGHDLAELDLAAVRRQCGVVGQHDALLAGDIKTNIVGVTDGTLDDAWAAARLAGIDQEIEAMPMGMHTLIADGPSTISDGQRQQVMIARAVCSGPRIIVFDEASCALDGPTQRLVADNLRNLDATRIVVAHRLSTVVEADRIVVLAAGRVVQTGTYRELIADVRGEFARLAGPQVESDRGGTR